MVGNFSIFVLLKNQSANYKAVCWTWNLNQDIINIFKRILFYGICTV